MEAIGRLADPNMWAPKVGLPPPTFHTPNMCGNTSTLDLWQWEGPFDPTVEKRELMDR